jgi:hypothetical protein
MSRLLALCQKEELLRLRVATSQGTLLVALVVSGITAWMNLLRRGALRMTRPAFISFDYDKVGPNGYGRVARISGQSPSIVAL